MTLRGSPFSGWGLFASLSCALLVMAAGLYAFEGGTDGIRLVIRATARTSLLLFLLAFTAGAARGLWPGQLTGWIRRNRRYLGLSFATSHLIHAAAIVTLARTAPPLFWSLSNPRSIILGSIGYAAIALLAATSFDRAVASLGPALWSRLHRGGVWLIWISFVFTFGKRIPASPWYVAPVLLLIAAATLRMLAGAQGANMVSRASGSRSG